MTGADLLRGGVEMLPRNPGREFLEQEPFCPHCHAPEMHPDGDKVLVRAFKVDDWSQCLVCSGHYDADWNRTPENHDPEKGWFA